MGDQSFQADLRAAQLGRELELEAERGRRMDRKLAPYCPPAAADRAFFSAADYSAAVSLLADARHLIKYPKHWCRKVAALDKQDRPCRPEDAGAWRYCAEGAIRAAAYALRRNATEQSGRQSAIHADIARDALDAAAFRVGWRNIVHANDAVRSHHMVVLTIWDAATADLQRLARR